MKTLNLLGLLATGGAFAATPNLLTFGCLAVCVCVAGLHACLGADDE